MSYESDMQFIREYLAEIGYPADDWDDEERVSVSTLCIQFEERGRLIHFLPQFHEEIKQRKNWPVPDDYDLQSMVNYAERLLRDSAKIFGKLLQPCP